MGCGCVPVVSNVGDIADVIVQGENGYVFNDTDDETEVSFLLEKLLNDPDRIAQMRSSVLRIKQEISVEGNGVIWKEILTSIVR